MKIVIGITGMPGAGKDVVSDFLVGKLNAIKIGGSMVLDEALRLFIDDQKIGREDQCALATFLRNRYGDGIIAKGVKKKIDEIPSGIFVSPGARDLGCYKFVRSFEKNIFLAVTADPLVRWQRMRGRKTKVDDDVSFEDFLAKERLPSELMITELCNKADFIIENNGSVRELFTRIAQVLDQSQLF